MVMVQGVHCRTSLEKLVGRQSRLQLLAMLQKNHPLLPLVAVLLLRSHLKLVLLMLPLELLAMVPHQTNPHQVMLPVLLPQSQTVMAKRMQHCCQLLVLLQTKSHRTRCCHLALLLMLLHQHFWVYLYFYCGRLSPDEQWTAWVLH